MMSSPSMFASWFGEGGEAVVEPLVCLGGSSSFFPALPFFSARLDFLSLKEKGDICTQNIKLRY